MKVSAAMTRAHGLCAVLLLAHASGAAHRRIVPELETISDPADSKFMAQDYPDDRRAKVFHKFDYPYPAVQDSEEYDKDYVSDKRDTDGYWTQQMKYDALKNKLAKEQDELKAALADLEKERRELLAAKERERQSELNAKKAEDHEKETDKENNKAQANATDAANGIDGAADKVGAEIHDLEECKRQLKEARAKLKALMDEKAKAEAHKKERDAHEANMEKAELQAEQAEEDAEKSVAELKAMYAKAKTDYQKELQDVKDVESALQKQAVVLHNYRSKSADPDGGVYPAKPDAKGGSVCMAGTSVLAVVAFVASL